jgi:hypothetical protein
MQRSLDAVFVLCKSDLHRYKIIKLKNFKSCNFLEKESNKYAIVFTRFYRNIYDQSLILTSIEKISPILISWNWKSDLERLLQFTLDIASNILL